MRTRSVVLITAAVSAVLVFTLLTVLTGLPGGVDRLRSRDTLSGAFPITQSWLWSCADTSGTARDRAPGGVPPDEMLLCSLTSGEKVSLQRWPDPATARAYLDGVRAGRASADGADRWFIGSRPQGPWFRSTGVGRYGLPKDAAGFAGYDGSRFTFVIESDQDINPTTILAALPLRTADEMRG